MITKDSAHNYNKSNTYLIVYMFGDECAYYGAARAALLKT